MKENKFKNGIKKVGNKIKEFPKEHPMIFTIGAISISAVTGIAGIRFGGNSMKQKLYLTEIGGIKGSIDLLVKNGVNEEDAKKMAINKFVDGIPYTTDDIREIHKMFWNRKREIEG